MRTFTQKSESPQIQSRPSPFSSSPVSRAAVRQTGRVTRLQPAVENPASKLALKAEPGSGPAPTATQSFGHDFSRIPVYPQERAATDEANAPAGVLGGKADCPPGMANAPRWSPNHHIMPEFLPLDQIKQPPVRTGDSHPAPSRMDPWRAPTVTGRVVADCEAKVWRYQLTSFFTGGVISIVYWGENHYPAPGPPTDDTGPLTNVEKKKWKEIVSQLEKTKAGSAIFWDSYRSQDLHEEYHWNVHWKGVIYEMLPRLEKVIETIGVPYTQALGFNPQPVTASEAEAILEPKMNTYLNIAYRKALADYKKIPDQVGDAAYRAQIPAFNFLIKRVKEYAAAKGWLSAGTQKGKEKESPSDK